MCYTYRAGSRNYCLEVRIVRYIYRLQTELQEGNVFTSVILSTGGGVVMPGSRSLPGRGMPGPRSLRGGGGYICKVPPEGTPPVLTSSGGHQSGCYTSYWNVFLLPRSRHPPGLSTPPRSRACCEIRSTRGRYASYWNANLFWNVSTLFG